jgi:hypothetical protein
MSLLRRGLAKMKKEAYLELSGWRHPNIIISGASPGGFVFVENVVISYPHHYDTRLA